MAGTLAFVYGTLAYTLFLGIFLYLIGFLGNVFVPKSIDSPAQTASGVALLVNLLLVSVFGLQHTVMARVRFKEWWTRFIPQPIERSTYVMFTCLVLGLIFWQWRPMPGVIWEVESFAGRVSLWALFWTGWALVLLSTFLIDHFDLFGMRQVHLYARGRAYRHLDFQISGLYRYVRHPLLLGFLITFWVTPLMTVGHLVFAAAMTTYILVAVQFEERDLARFHGEPYEDYRRRVPMLLPVPRLGKARAPEVSR